MTKEFLCATALNIEACLIDKAVSFIDHVTLGHSEEADDVWDSIELVDAVLTNVNAHKPNIWIDPNKVHLKQGSRFLDTKKNTVSLQGMIVPDLSIINCISDEQLCDQINKLNSICNCHG